MGDGLHPGLAWQDQRVQRGCESSVNQIWCGVLSIPSELSLRSHREEMPGGTRWPYKRTPLSGSQWQMLSAAHMIHPLCLGRLAAPETFPNPWSEQGGADKP